MRKIFYLLYLCGLMAGCRMREALPAIDNLEHDCMNDLTAIIIRDVVSPPVASRIYAYSTLAYYEGIRHLQPGTSSLTAQLKGFASMPVIDNDEQYHFPLVAMQAFYRTAHALVFSKDSLAQLHQSKMKAFEKALPPKVYKASLLLGDRIAAIILQRAENDHYRQTRGLPRYNVDRIEGRWYPTPPDYMDAMEPYWYKIVPLLLDSASQYKPAPPPAYNITDKEGQYYRELMETKNTVAQLTPQQDSIARYWDDNAYVTEHKGHLVYATKKTTPGGHWLGICAIVCKQAGVDAVRTAKAYALTAAAIMDGFIACWDEKYRSNMVRPVTVIREYLGEDWWPILQTPPFPEYTSGHSVISVAAATVLTHLFGDNFAFTDTTEMPYLGMQRSFPSLMAAAEESGISRLYGGIHFRSAIEQGKWQGKQVGNLYSKLQ